MTHPRDVTSLSPLTLGTMNFGARTPAKEAQRIVERALELGVCFFDTANLYGDGESERLLGDALQGSRERVGIATKVGLLRKNGKREGLSARRIQEALEESLGRLRTGVVDLYYLHAPDNGTPLEDTLDGMQALLEGGKIRAWGISNFAAWQIALLNAACDARKMPRPKVSQVLYNLLVRQLDVEYFAFARAHGIHTTVYNPLAGGLLARSPSAFAKVPPGSRFETNKLYRRRYWTEALFDQTRRFGALAQEVGMDLVSFSYAWLSGAPGVDSILCGPGSVAHLEQAVDACKRTLTPETRARVDELHREYLGTDACYAR
jgi:aryl-alcohol dehydrogenase-like predicted oxidoreductase